MSAKFLAQSSMCYLVVVVQWEEAELSAEKKAMLYAVGNVLGVLRSARPMRQKKRHVD